MINDTKERILDTALTMFSTNGYAGTSMGDLAASLGITKAALYKHYASKEQIRDMMLDRIETYYRMRFGSKEHLPPVPETAEELIGLTMKLVDFTIHDDRIIRSRKMLTLEQYHDERACRLATQHFVVGTCELFTELFRGMIGNGLIRNEDPDMLAFAYTAPISALIHLCDREPDREREVIGKIRAFAEYFLRNHQMNEPR